jgi:hypothetical protein
VRPDRLLALALLLASGPALAQEEHAHAPVAPRGWIGARAIPLVTHASPVLDGDSRTELSLSQTMVMGGARLLKEVQASVMLNLEGLTLPDGEPTAGIWGEGFVDRRHPHTFLHEATVTVVSEPGSRAASVTAGRGFVPFGSDDPMVRPFVKFPLNHHLSQVLERLILVGAVRAGPALLEAALFNGDEPDGAGSLGTLSRFGDSWSVRATLRPVAGLEISASHARLDSPEQPTGGGLDHAKTHAGVRWERGASSTGGGYALLEWSRTGESNLGQTAFSFHTVLAEGALRRRAGQLALRVEQTERPDEERLEDPFRTPFPHGDVHLLGISRWRVATLSVSRELAWGAVRGQPFVEGAAQWVRPLRTPSAFVPREFYGSERLWSLSLGARLEVGAAHSHRPGRYGAATQP